MEEYGGHITILIYKEAPVNHKQNTNKKIGKEEVSKRRDFE
jgi:hypothetical protein